MALDKDVLGAALYTMSQEFNNSDIAPENMETARQNFWKGIAEEVINHLKNAGVVHVNVSTTGTASAQTGTGTGTIE